MVEEQATETRRIPSPACGKLRRCGWLGPRRAAGAGELVGPRRKLTRREVVMGKGGGEEERVAGRGGGCGGAESDCARERVEASCGIRREGGVIGPG